MFEQGPEGFGGSELTGQEFEKEKTQVEFDIDKGIIGIDGEIVIDSRNKQDPETGELRANTEAFLTIASLRAIAKKAVGEGQDPAGAVKGPVSELLGLNHDEVDFVLTGEIPTWWPRP